MKPLNGIRSWLVATTAATGLACSPGRSTSGEERPAPAPPAIQITVSTSVPIAEASGWKVTLLESYTVPGPASADSVVGEASYFAARFLLELGGHRAEVELGPVGSELRLKSSTMVGGRKVTFLETRKSDLILVLQ